MRASIEAAKGNWGTVEFAIRLSGKVPAQEFFENELRRIYIKGKGGATAADRMAVIFQQAANYGPNSLTEKAFKTEMPGLCAFRREIRKLIRMPCFFDGNRVIITHGFFKPGAQKGMGSWPQAEISRAQEIRGEYLTRKNAKK